jgi:hypothetical protein
MAEDYYRAKEVLREVDWNQFHKGWFEINDASDCATGACPIK